MMDKHTPYTDGFKHPHRWCATHERDFDLAEYEGGQFTNKDIVGKYVSHYLYTDVQCVGKIVGTFGKTGIIVQPMKATQGEWKAEWHVGGFAGHCSNQHAQVWNFELTDEEPIRMRLCTRFFSGRGHRMGITENPYKFHDYNF